MNFLVFRLYGAMASWGEAAVGGSRPSAISPSRSAILGLLGAALGIKRDETDSLKALQQSVCIGVKQLRVGQMMRDYHTAEVPSTDKKRPFYTRKDELSQEKVHTILSTRDYRAEGLWTVAIWLNAGQSNYSLAQFSKALKKPKFILSLGRKSCPLSAPLQPVVLENSNLKAALDFKFNALLFSDQEKNEDKKDELDNRWLRKDKIATYFWEGDSNLLNVDLSQVQSKTKWDEPLDRKRWQFAFRIEHQVSIDQESE